MAVERHVGVVWVVSKVTREQVACDEADDERSQDWRSNSHAKSVCRVDHDLLRASDTVAVDRCKQQRVNNDLAIQKRHITQ